MTRIIRHAKATIFVILVVPLLALNAVVGAAWWLYGDAFKLMGRELRALYLIGLGDEGSVNASENL